MMNENNWTKMTDLDCLVSPEPLQIMKAMIPYTAPGGQRVLSILAKALELQNTLRTFGGRPDMSVCSAQQSPEQNSPVELLNGIRSYCSPATRQRMDECINLFSILQMAEQLGEMDESPEGGD